MSFDLRTPDVTFNTRVQIDEAPGFEFRDLTTQQIFDGKRVVVFGLPGAFTPTCSSTHLPTFESYYDEICKNNVDEIYCISVNDTFVMNAWFNNLDIRKVKALPDGSGEFTRKMGFLVDKSNIGFGMRSWRYAMVVDNGVVEMLWIEPGMDDNVDGDPFTVSDADTCLKWLEENA